MCNFPPTEETAKHSSFDDLSAKVKVLEAENESLKTFIKESSDKENEKRKELSEKHARELTELNDKLKKSQSRVTSLVAKNKVQEAEAEAIDKLIFRKHPFLGIVPTSIYAFLSMKELNPIPQQALDLSGQRSQPSRGRRHMTKRGVPSTRFLQPVAESPRPCL
jgi:ElaB/YqjD/DUF883 family membrane-anchored ribosome-binding protein